MDFLVSKCKKIVIVAIFLACFPCFSQEIMTAATFFQSVSEKYGTLTDFEATMHMSIGDDSMSARMSFKRPNLLRLDFSDPETQTIVFNGETLTIYLPQHRTILNQTVEKSGGSGGMSLATPQGLVLMSRYYTIAYEVGQDPIPLEEGSEEQVIKLVLTRRTRSESFRSMVVSVTPASKMIRRIVAEATDGRKHVYNFSNYKLNSGIPDMRFVYDAPASANNYNNFLSTN
ncbi:MAG: outer membrane lipoprotein carrier protein LolA [Spirochaetaceae bacterium]|nr:outer membrane lipoprotein carrier protein LolA [Spirochaetaceae bacterium]